MPPVQKYHESLSIFECSLQMRPAGEGAQSSCDPIFLSERIQPMLHEISDFVRSGENLAFVFEPILIAMSKIPSNG